MNTLEKIIDIVTEKEFEKDSSDNSSSDETYTDSEVDYINEDINRLFKKNKYISRRLEKLEDKLHKLEKAQDEVTTCKRKLRK